jgi:hypothetical protein
MPDIVSVSFRDQATGKINDLLIDEDKACAQTQNLLSYLAGVLLNYQDEGIEFLPSIVLCDSIQKALQAFPGAITHYVGEAALEPESGRKILKDCAPLSNTNWFIFIERIEDGKVKYGVFTYLRLPTAISLQEGITIGAAVFCVLIRKVSPTTVEIRGSKGSVLSLIFSTVRGSGTESTEIASFAAHCCSTIPTAQVGDIFKTYFVRLLEESLSASHGTMLICAKDLDLPNISGISDSVLVQPMLDLYAAFADYHATNTAESILTLQRCEELLRGFLRCDGIVVFDSASRVIAYRAFYRPTGESADNSRGVIGGARRRAFEGIKSLVGNGIASVLFRSQDGLTLHHGSD